MNLLRAIVESGWAGQIGWTLLHSLWLGAAAAALLAAALAALRNRSPSVRYVVACAALAMLVAATVATSFLVRAPAGTVAGRPADLTAASPIPIAAASSDDRRAAGAPRPARPAPSPAAPAPSVSERLSQALAPAMPWAAFAWMGGVVAMSCWHLLGWAGTRRIRRLSSLPGEPAVLETLARLAEIMGVRNAVTVLQSALVKGPAVIGWLKPAILLPASLGTGLSPWQLEAILAHELAHVRRYDYLVNLLQMLVETLLFYHPAVWYISRRIRAERENCCDDAAIGVCGDPHAYAEALVTAAEESRGPRRAVAYNGADLLPRVRRILGQGERGPAAPAPLLAAIAMALVAGVAILPLVTTSAAARDPLEAAVRQPASRPAAPANRGRTTLVKDESPDLRSALILDHLLRVKMPSEWLVGSMAEGRLRVPGWNPLEANAIQIEVFRRTPRGTPGSKPASICIWLVEPTYEGAPAEVAGNRLQPIPREFGSWRGRKVVILGDGTAAGWDSYEQDLKVVLKESETAPNDANAVGESMHRTMAEMARRARAATRPAP